jgi:hypothetical protein
MAAYDPVSNTLWVSKESYANYFKNKERDELRRSILHELTHARQHKALLQGVKVPEDRKRLIRKEALSMTEENM